MKNLSFHVFSLLVALTASAYAVDLGAASSFPILAAADAYAFGESRIAGAADELPSVGAWGNIALPDGQPEFGFVTQDLEWYLPDAEAAYDEIYDGGCTTIDGALGGQTLVPGTYCAPAFTLNGALWLEPVGAAGWIFRAATLDVTSGSTVRVVGGGELVTACRVWWGIQEWVALGGAPVGEPWGFLGTVIAQGGIGMMGAFVAGGLISLGGNVEIEGWVSIAACIESPPPDPDAGVPPPDAGGPDASPPDAGSCSTCVCSSPAPQPWEVVACGVTYDVSCIATPRP